LQSLGKLAIEADFLKRQKDFLENNVPPIDEEHYDFLVNEKKVVDEEIEGLKRQQQDLENFKNEVQKRKEQAKVIQQKNERKNEELEKQKENCKNVRWNLIITMRTICSAEDFP
jgi:DNA repair exonuclease SbcCD ATPase subunit